MHEMFMGDGLQMLEINQKIWKVGQTRPLTIEEVMLDEEFLKDYEQLNKTLFRYLTIDKMVEMAKFLINEPDF